MPATGFAILGNFPLQLWGILFCNFLHFCFATNISITDTAGHKYEFIDYRDKKLLTVLGEIKVKRAYYYDKESNSGFCPKDRTLDIEGTSYSLRGVQDDKQGWRMAAIRSWSGRFV